MIVFSRTYVYKLTRFFIHSMFLSDEGPTLETLDFTLSASQHWLRSTLHFMFLSDEGPTLEAVDFAFYIGSTPTFLYFDLNLNTAYAEHYRFHVSLWQRAYVRNVRLRFFSDCISTLRLYQYVCLLTGIRNANVFPESVCAAPIACQVPLMQQVFLVSGFQLDSDTHSFSAFRIKTSQY